MTDSAPEHSGQTAGTGGPAHRSRRRWIAAISALALLFCAYLIAGFYLVPGLIRSEATAWVKTNLGKPIAIGEIRFNPLGFKLDISDIAIPDTTRPMVAVGHFHLDFSILSVFQHAWRLDEVRLDRPFAHALIRADGSLNLSELVPPTRPDAGPTPAFRIGSLAVNQGRIDFADLSREQKPEKTLAPITFTLRDFESEGEQGGQFALNAKSERREAFAWRGTLAMTPIASQGRFTVADLQAKTIQDFLGESLPVTLTAGRISLEGRYDFAYGKNGLRLDAGLPRIALSGFDFAGHDDLFHGGLHLDAIEANVARIAFNSDARNRVSLSAQMPRLAVKGAALSGNGPARGESIRLADGALDGMTLDFTTRRIAVSALRLGGLDVGLGREKDGQISLMKLLPPQRLAPVAAAQPTPPAAQPWNARLDSLSLTGAALHIQDRMAGARFDIAPIAFSITGAGTDLSQPISINLDARINAKASLTVDGTVTPGTKAAELNLALAGLPLRLALPYMPAYPTLDLRSGDVAASGAFSLSGGDHSQMRFKGNAALANLNLYEHASNNQLLAWRAFQLTGISYQPGQVDIARARLSKPFGRIAILPDRSFNFTSLLTPPGAATQAATVAPKSNPAKTAAMTLRLKQLDIDNGTISFADYSMDPNFEARIEALQGGIKNISTLPDGVATLDLNGQVIDHFSPVTITGTINPLGYDRATDIKMAFRNIELPIFNPYSGRYAGYAIAKGKLTTLLSYKIDNRALLADHHVIIDQLQWGEATESKDKVPLPIRLATALLKDKDGVIDLDIPVTGSLDDPSFRLGPLIWKVVGNVLEKIAVAPFRFIGSLFAGAEQAQFVDFAPGSAALPPGATSGLSALAKGLSERPALQLDIPAGPGIREDAIAIADTRIDTLLMDKEIKRGRPAVFTALDAGEQNDRTLTLYKAKFGKKPAFPEQLVPPPSPDAKPGDAKPADANTDDQQTIAETGWMRGELRKAFLPSNAELAALGSTRASAVRDALAAGGAVDPARIFLTTGQAPTAEANAVRFELQLK
jgi:uncharacterized protein involved in outer membrane biogenesis